MRRIRYDTCDDNKNTSFFKTLRATLPLGFSVLLSLAPAGAQSTSNLSTSSLNVDGLNHETELAALYLGDFANARLEPSGTRYLGLLNGYIKAFSDHCPSHLPANKVMITESVCVAETVTRNGFGVEVGRYCSRYVDRPTGRYGDPRLMAISSRLEAEMARGMLGSMFNPDGMMQSSRQTMDIVVSLGDDMDRLFRNNACSSGALERLQTNIERFGNGEQPLRLASGATLASTREASGPFRDSDYRRLLDAMIAENARGWMVNRYIGGSASDVSVQNRDGQGRPARIRGRYAFNSFGGSSNGTVTLTFEDGLPKCLYFFDAPQTCRLPSRRLITAYEKGEFQAGT